MTHAWRGLSAAGLLSRAAVLAGVAFLAGCAGLRTPAPGAADAGAPPVACQIVYDAGSSGTRLFVYAREGSGWREQAGPKTVALADPVRQIRGKTHADIDAVTTGVVEQLDRIRQDGPASRNGKPEWQAFDWTRHCRVTDAMVLATAGMRIAEQEDRERSRQLWTQLKSKLQARLGAEVRVQARTLTGFEEGLYAWLAAREGRLDNRFGIAEMGGASAQVSFPCPDCEAGDDAVRSVRVKDQTLRFYSYSFLGLGQDEAPKVLGVDASCRYGVALTQPGWKRSDCADRIDLTRSTDLKDPYNFGSSPPAADARRDRGTTRRIPTDRAAIDGWVLTGAFNFLKSDAVQQCCEQQSACFEAPTSCFRAVYLDKYLGNLGIPVTSPRADVSWTHGAVVCSESRCLEAATPAPVCRWSASGCL